MNFLALCKRLRQEAGYSGNGPASVKGQAGEAQRIVDWVRSAWLDIQTMHDDWKFMRETFSCTIAEQENACVAVPERFHRIKEKTVVFRRPDGSRYFPTEITPEEMLVVQRDQTDIAGIPQLFSVDDGVMTVFPTAKETITVSGDFFCTPKEFTENTDVPVMPEQYHMAIVWYALTQVGGFDESPNLYARGGENFQRLFSAMNGTQRPNIQRNRPLA